MSKELGVSYNVSKLEPKLKPHQFPGFLNGLPTGPHGALGIRNNLIKIVLFTREPWGLGCELFPDRDFDSPWCYGHASGFSGSAEYAEHTGFFWWQRQPFLVQPIYVLGCLAISSLAPRPHERAFACV